MGAGKQTVIAAGFAMLKATRVHTLLAPVTRGAGAILMLHHVRPWTPRAFTPNRPLEIEPGFLDAALGLVRARGFDIVSLDEAIARLDAAVGKPFVALTFDDGYRDLVAHALPVLERHAAPFTAFITTGFADRNARLWWVELEEAIAALDRVTVDVGDGGGDGGAKITLPTRTPREKRHAFSTLYWMLRGGPEAWLLDVIAGLLEDAGLSSAGIAERLCLDWDAVAALARHPLCAIGAHTLTHPMLAKHPDDVARREIGASRALIAARTGRDVRHLAYPVGDPTSAGPRDFALARELGFDSAVTTRPGMLFRAHRDHRHALPRLSINGHWQTLDSLDVLLSGVPFAAWNRGKRINVA